MKHIYPKILLIAILTLCLNAGPLGAQENILDRKIHLEIKKEPLYKALIRINQITDYKFSYNSELVNENKTVSIRVDDITVRETLDSLFRDTTLVYNLVDQHIVIHRKNDKAALVKDSALTDTSGYIQLEGTITGAETGTPLPYANIGIYNKSIGTVSNLNGAFVLKVRDAFAGDTLVFSFMGYENRFIPMEQFSRGEVVQLERKLYTIQEVIVRTFDADMVIRQALSHVRTNYYFDPVISTGFYRETIKREDEYTSLSEAVIEMYKPYNKVFQSPKIKILKSRKSTQVNKRDSINLKLKAGLEAVLLLDIIHGGISFFNSLYYPNYEYSVANISHYDGHNTYVINFSPALDADMPLYEGKLYIDVKTLALVSAEFHLDRENLKKVSQSLIIKKKWDLHVKPKEVSYYVNYRRIKNKYFLNQIRGELFFKVRKKGELFADDFRVSFGMFSSSIDTTYGERFNKGQLANPHKVFIEQIKDYDAEFWGSYNYIAPDEPLEEIVRKLGSKIDILKEEE